MLSGKTGYIAITSFTKETVKQYENALSDLEKKGQKGLIVDLRGNGGGSLTAVVDILDRMLPKGKLITEKNKVNGDKVYTSTDEKHFDKPVAVLILSLIHIFTCGINDISYEDLQKNHQTAAG